MASFPCLLAQMTALCCLAFLPGRVVAQIVPDGTLPVNSTVTPLGNLSEITGGTTAGSNLFHSFQQFSVPTGSAAHFNNAPNIQNIITRVTGGSISNIDGLLGANGTANLFLLNPNGIIFGPNAALNIGGSFVASTARGLKFADGTEFSATNPQSAPLLTISVPVGLQFPGMPGSILNQSRAVNGESVPVGLAVQPGRTLALAGGDVTLAGGLLSAPGGRIELGSAGGNSLVSLNPTERGLVLGYEGVRDFGNIQLTQSGVSTSSPLAGGDIQVRGARVTLNEGSFISTSTLGAGAAGNLEVRATDSVELNEGSFISTSTLGAGAAGNLAVRATDSVELTGTGSIGDLLQKIFQGTLTASDLRNGLFAASFGAGASGNLTIDTGKLIARNGAVASTSSFGEGLGGNLTVNATESAQLVNAGLLTGTAGSQKAGDLTINTGTLRVLDGGVVATSTLGTGQGGNLTVSAQSVELAGLSASEFSLPPPIFSKPQQIPSSLLTLSLAAGNAGSLAITTNQFTLENGAAVSTSTFGAGAGGNLDISATDSVKLAGTGKLEILEKIFASDPANRLDASGLRSGLFASSFGTGRAGNITIATGLLSVGNGAVVSASTFKEGVGGSLTVSADAGAVELRGGGLLTGTAGSQKAGDLTINTGTLRVLDGGIVATSTLLGTGQGGNLTVSAGSVELSGLSNPNDLYNLPRIFGDNSPRQQIPSGLLTLSFGSGDAGNLKIDTAQFKLENGAAISTSTFLGAGKGGDITIQASQSAELTGTGKLAILEEIFALPDSTIDPSDLRSGLFASSFSSGRAGDITIKTGRLTVQNGAVVSASTFKEGVGGSLTVSADAGAVELRGGGLLTGTAGSQKAGDLTINTGTLRVLDGGIVATSTLLGSGQGGNLTVSAGSVELSGLSNPNDLYNLPRIFGDNSPRQQIPSSLLTLSFGPGDAGNLKIDTAQFKLENGAAVSTSTFGAGRGGNLTLSATDSVELAGTGTFEQSIAVILAGQFDASNLRNGLFTSSFCAGAAGDLTIDTGKFIARNGALASASTFVAGSGGNLTLTTPRTGSVELTDAGLLTGTVGQAGNAGELKITTGQLTLLNGAGVATATLGVSPGGKLTVSADSVELRGTSADGQVPSGLFTLTFSPQRAGDLEIQTERLTVANGANVAASTFSSGDGGNIEIRASESVKLIDPAAENSQFPTGLRSDALDQLRPFNLTLIPASGTGKPGNLTVETGRLLLRDGAQIAVSAGQTDNGGNITINADTLVAFPRENSDISADATTGSGGKVNITAQGIFGAEFRNQPTESSDITASSQQGAQGIVEFNRPATDPSQSVANLPENPIDPAEQVSPVCSATGEPVTGEFIITGRGGLPPAPGDPPSSDTVRVGLVAPAPPSSSRAGGTKVTPARRSVSLPPPATGIAFDDKGQLILTAGAPNGTPHTPWLPTANCHAR
ncbi:MAG: filamentous hemagglutinin N-terminal domain-containing protein [Oscillatoria princeps RMCB-10]|nr:filamentous hemagglutinin N-terminal domain-containing protein [Oscillatoria princeps RMCB-10]